MKDWIVTDEGQTRTIDALLDYITVLLREREQLKEELRFAVEVALTHA